MVMNSGLLDFQQQIDYRAHDEITLSVKVASATGVVRINTKLDTASKFCVFQPHHAESLGLVLTSGIPQIIRTATGSFNAFGHTVTLAIEDLTWEATVYFAEPEGFPVSVVGRIGFLDRLQMGLIDGEQLLYLSPYPAPE